MPPGFVAIVNGTAISKSQLDDAVRGSRQPHTQELRRALKHDLITRELLRQLAEAAHYDTRPEVRQAVDAARVELETRLYIKDHIHPEPVSDAQISARYDEIVASLHSDEYLPRIIEVAGEATAKEVLTQLDAGGDFAALARQYSLSPSKGAGGLLNWMDFKAPTSEGNAGGLAPPVALALKRLPVGGTALVPVAVNDLRVIVRLDAKRASPVPTLDQMKDTIRLQLEDLALRKACAQFATALLDDATIVQ
ncbi:peptidyl-prolyl cis-trans isomerase [Paraburkholderia sp.]|uniref:peptidyl-prolyl cis-trans isomerase n=1 Tax=Paraburkholderia sp. TaxID=1926495 RepID=UPI002F3FD62F